MGWSSRTDAEGVDGAERARADPNGKASHSSLLSVSIDSPEAGSLRMSSSDNSLEANGHHDAVELQSHQVSWSRQLGPGSSNVRAQVVDESNFFSGGLLQPAGLPGGKWSGCQARMTACPGGRTGNA